MKPLGFRKFGRTLHRFVSGDISQVINFQCGFGTYMCVNVGIRIPECAERTFYPEMSKKYYHEYECSIRSRLGTVSGKRETWYDLSKSTVKITAKVLAEIRSKVLPVFDILCDRQAILEHRKEYPPFDAINRRLIFLEECMIYGHLGDTENAKELFEEYYRQAVEIYNSQMTKGTRHYLRKGQRLVYFDQDITADKDGYVTVYGANHAHIEHLDELAAKLGLR